MAGTNGVLAVFTPMPPARTGIADYCYELLPALARHWELYVVVEKRLPDTPPMPEGVTLVTRAEWKADEARDYATPRLYHLGNNHHHAYILEELLVHPGVAVLHDFTLHHLIVEMTLAQGLPGLYETFMRGEFGRLGERTARLRERGVYTEYQTFLMPLNTHVLSRALGVIVHSDWSLRHLQLRNEALPAARVPLHYAPPTDIEPELTREAAKASLGVSPETLVVSSLGFVTPPKQVELAIRALGALRDRLPPFEFRVVGEASDPAGLEQTLKTHGIADVTRVTGFVPMEELHRTIVASDLIMNLRYPSAGETSAALVRGMGMGRCSVVFDYGSYADFPDDTVVKVPLDTQATDALEQAIDRVLTDEHYRTAVENTARHYINREHSSENAAQQYTAFMHRCLERAGRSYSQVVVENLRTILPGFGQGGHRAYDLEAPEHDLLLHPMEWHGPEGYRWMAAPVARMVLEVPADARWLEIDAASPHERPSTLDVWINGLHSGASTFERPGTQLIRLPIPEGVVGGAELMFQVSEVRTLPAHQGDPRRMGLGVRSVRLQRF